MDPFLKAMKTRLLDHQISDDLLSNVLKDYETRLKNDPASLKPVAFEVEDVIDKYDLKLKETFHHEMATTIAAFPFISLMSYMILGFGFDFWHPGWLVFILIFVLMLIFSVFHYDVIAGLLALIPFLIIISYFIIGFYVRVWHPTWLVFLLVPMIGIFTVNRRNDIKFLLFALSPLLSITLYLLLGFYLTWWNKAWVVFLLVPMIACLQEEDRNRLLTCEISLFIAFLIGFILPYLTSSWAFSFFGLLVPSFAFMTMGEDSLIKFTKDTTIDWIIVISLIFIYLGLGLFADGWAYGWLLLLIIPAYEIIKQSTEHFKVFYISPFIAIAIFYSLGYFFNLWHIAWLVFLIPIILYMIERD